MKLVCVDLGYGNLGSVAIAFERLGVTPEISGDPAVIAAADRLVLPGVGHAGFAMRQAKARGLDRLFATITRPLLGICLGMQLLFERTEEEDTPGLGLLPGRVRRLDPAPGRPVPHMGWSKLTVADDTLGLVTGDYVYFAHSFACDDTPATIASADYGRPIPAVVRSGKLTGAQFHPERSGAAGARFLSRMARGMIVYPAMDLIGGRPVRLRQGRFEDATFYDEAPADALARFAAAGAEWAHIVDLDGTRVGEPIQHAAIGKLARGGPLKLQVAGGIRSASHIARLFEQGVERAVVGSLCVTRPDLVAGMLDSFGPERITLALDVHVEGGVPMVAMHGWQAASGISLWEVADRFPTARHLLLTDIGKDGMLQGPNQPLYAEAVGRLPHLAIQASGGISSAADIAHLPTAGVIVGKALWEGRIAPGELFA